MGYRCESRTTRSEITIDDEDNEDRIIVFASYIMLQQLRQANTWICDGTFKVVPGIFFQLYTIHAVRRDFVFPSIYALLPGKTANVYRRLLSIVKDACPNISPNFIITDFEKAAQNSFQEQFLVAHLQGCLFQLSQAVWRKIQELGLAVTYMENEEARFYCKALCSLAFLPERDVPITFGDLQNDLEDADLPDADLAPLYNYFEDTYIGRLNRRRGRIETKFPSKLWNVRERTM